MNHISAHLNKDLSKKKIISNSTSKWATQSINGVYSKGKSQGKIGSNEQSTYFLILVLPSQL